MEAVFEPIARVQPEVLIDRVGGTGVNDVLAKPAAHDAWHEDYRLAGHGSGAWQHVTVATTAAINLAQRVERST